MAFNINNFLTNMPGDGARPNIFEIFFPQLGPNFPLRATASSLPASMVGVARAYYFGREAKFGGNRVFSDWTINVIVDEPDFIGGPRSFLEQWSNGINTHVSNLRTMGTAPSAYQRDAVINQYGKAGNLLAVYQMRNCFPTNIGEIQLDWGANDQLEMFQVTFALQWWQRVGTTDIG